MDATIIRTIERETGASVTVTTDGDVTHFDLIKPGANTRFSYSDGALTRFFNRIVSRVVIKNFLKGEAMNLAITGAIAHVTGATVVASTEGQTIHFDLTRTGVTKRVSMTSEVISSASPEAVANRVATVADKLFAPPAKAKPTSLKDVAIDKANGEETTV